MRRGQRSCEAEPKVEATRAVDRAGGLANQILARQAIALILNDCLLYTSDAADE